jgi:carbon monoxide dehydrogenase subunit G
VKISIASQLPVERGRAFAALVDPEILRRSIPGCEELTATGADTYAARLKIGLAGLKGTYNGSAAIRDKHPPERLTLTFDGRGAPGFVRGSAAITLTDTADGTAIGGEADVQVGGLIAAVGSRLVEAAGKKLADDFFRKLAEQLSQKPTTVDTE